jgi:hypothetical protein
MFKVGFSGGGGGGGEETEAAIVFPCWVSCIPLMV